MKRQVHSLTDDAYKTRIYTFKDMVEYTIDWSRTLPGDFDVIIGIPRGGLLIAGIIASRFNKPLTIPELFLEGKIWSSKDSPPVDFNKIKKTLIIDDSIATGKRLDVYLAQIKEKYPNVAIKIGALFKSEKNTYTFDYYYKIARFPIIFEWNLLSAGYNMGKLCTDMDGVLSKDCPAELDDDGEKYVTWMKTAESYLIPTYKIDTIITSRLEKYRKETEEWLRAHNVKYDNLIMLDLPTKSQRTFESVVAHKSKYINQAKPFWYWESNYNEALEIKKHVSCYVLCIDEVLIL